MEQTLQRHLDAYLRGALIAGGFSEELARPAMRIIEPQFSAFGVLPESVLLRVSRSAELVIHLPRELQEEAAGLREIHGLSNESN